MSASLRKQTNTPTSRYVRFVPKADICGAANRERRSGPLLRDARRWDRMDILAPRCLNNGRDITWRNDHEKAQYAWDRRWCRVIGCGGLLASMVPRECGPCGATANGVTR